jgi:ABC-type glutathione transport system ATPase component
MNELLQASGLTVDFQHRASRLNKSASQLTTALSDVDLQIASGSILGIVGESGAGKSTLAKTLTGLIAPTAGTIRYAGTPLAYPRSRETARAIQMVSQDPGSSLNPALSVRTVLSELLRFHRLVPAELVDARTHELMDLVGLAHSTLSAKPRDLSGGERQRVALARALAVEPTVLIADEVVSALDTPVQAGIINLLRELRDRLAIAVVVISHDLAVIHELCEKVIIVHRGGIVERGATDDVFAQPSDPYTRSLLDSAHRFTLPAAGRP